MMDCHSYRRAVIEDPNDAAPQLRGHRESCADCSAFTARLTDFEARLNRALRVDVPRRSSRAAGNRMGWLAMAASVLLAVVVAGGLLLSVPDRSLAADVVMHMQGEPQAWRRTDEPVPSPALQDVLRNSHLRLAGGVGVVSYAASCEFRGHRVPHLVIQTESGPVTVMVLVHEHAAREMQFDEQGYRGVIVPVAGHGSVAVLTRGRVLGPKAVEHLASRVLDSVVWTG